MLISINRYLIIICMKSIHDFEAGNKGRAEKNLFSYYEAVFEDVAYARITIIPL